MAAVSAIAGAALDASLRDAVEGALADTAKELDEVPEDAVADAAQALACLGRPDDARRRAGSISDDVVRAETLARIALILARRESAREAAELADFAVREAPEPSGDRQARALATAALALAEAGGYEKRVGELVDACAEHLGSGDYDSALLEAVRAAYLAGHNVRGLRLLRGRRHAFLPASGIVEHLLRSGDRAEVDRFLAELERSARPQPLLVLAVHLAAGDVQSASAHALVGEALDIAGEHGRDATHALIPTLLKLFPPFGLESEIEPTIRMLVAHENRWQIGGSVGQTAPDP